MSQGPERRWRDDPDAPAAVRRALNAEVPKMPDAVRAAVLASLAPPPPAAPIAAKAALSPLTIGAAIMGVAAVIALVVLLGRDRGEALTPPRPSASAPSAPVPSASASAPVPSASASAPVPSAMASASGSNGSAPVSVPTVSATATASTVRPRASVEIDTLAEETALVGRARERLASDPNAALVAVDAHATKFPNGALASEREYVRISALRRLGRIDEAKTHAQRYVTRFPSSPQVPAVRRFLEEGQ